MANEAFASLLRNMAFLAEMKGENPFKIRAWQKSADLLEEQSAELAELIAGGEITRIPGIGKGTQALAKEFVETGKLTDFIELRAGFPANILELTEVRGLGPKKIKVLYESLGIGSLTELEYACQENRLIELKGFGQKTQDSLLKGIAALKANRGRAILPMALQRAEEVRAELSELTGATRVEETGELRRLLPVQDKLEFLVTGDLPKLRIGLAGAGFREEAGAWRRRVEEHLPEQVWLSDAASFGSRWLETTGPAHFVAQLGKVSAAASEEEIFAHVNKAMVPPEARDLGAAPADLVEESDIKGVFHLHTNWSDGKNTLAEMAEAAVELGFEYLGVSEHSQTAFYAHGLDAKRVGEQRGEIERLREKFPSLRIFHGIESDILSDGSLDFPDEVLKKFDFVIASVHGQMRMNREDMTNRLCRALEHPATTWLGHWTGRILLGREPYDFDREKVLRCAAAHGKSIELNSNPYRLDMDWAVVPEATALGIPIGIFPDAHSVGGLRDLRYGVWMARKAGLTAAQVVNTKSGEEMAQWLNERRFR